MRIRSVLLLNTKKECSPKNPNLYNSTAQYLALTFVFIRSSRIQNRNCSSAQCCIQIFFMCLFRTHAAHFYFHFYINCVKVCVCGYFYLVNILLYLDSIFLWAHQSLSWAIPIEYELCDCIMCICCSICVHAYKCI